MYAFEKIVSGLGIPDFGFYIGQASKELKCRSLTGLEKLKVFRNINIHSLLPSVNSAECDRIQHLWSELHSPNTIFSKPASELPAAAIREYEQRARQWGPDFVDMYQSDRVTPYIHCMMNHVHEFTQQGLAKLNHNTTKQLFRSSCHHGEDAIRQLIEKQNQLEHLEDLGAKRQKVFEVTCSKCSKNGHNRLTCNEACHGCGFKPYHEHLTNTRQNDPTLSERELCTSSHAFIPITFCICTYFLNRIINSEHYIRQMKVIGTHVTVILLHLVVRT